MKVRLLSLKNSTILMNKKIEINSVIKNKNENQISEEKGK